MLTAYGHSGKGLIALEAGAGSLIDDRGAVTIPDEAVWIDLFRPLPRQVEAVRALGVDVPTLEEMEQIEISNRLFREEGLEYLTVVLPGKTADGEPSAGPVTFILTPDRLVTVRHHAPRPFEVFPPRAAQSAAGCGSPDRIFLGLGEEIVARLADLLEAAGRVLDEAARSVFAEDATSDSDALQATLRRVGQQGELIGRVRLALLTMERAVSYFGAIQRDDPAQALIKGLMRDIQALSVHSDYLSGRIGLTVDATMGMINLLQNATVRIVSVAAVLFLPPTLVASIYGMNFHLMPELDSPWGYPAALALMLASAVGCYLIFKWKKWL